MPFRHGTLRKHRANARSPAMRLPNAPFGRRNTVRSRLAALAALCSAFLLAGCHGSTLDAIYPGSLGHTPPPAVNLPPQDQGLEQL